MSNRLKIERDSIDLVIDTLDKLGIETNDGAGKWGNPDLHAECGGVSIQIEVKSTQFVKTYLLKNASNRSYRLNSIDFSQYQLDAMKKAQKKGHFVIIVVVMRTQRKNAIKFMFPKDVKGLCMSVSDIIDVSIPIKYLPMFCARKIQLEVR